MKRAVIVGVVSAMLVAGVVIAAQGWSDDQDGDNFSLYNVNSVQINSGAGVGTSCAQFDNTGLLSPTGTPCGAGLGGSSGGTVTVVTGTDPIHVTGAPTVTPNVTIQGAIVSGSTSTTKQNIGLNASGVVEQTTSSGIATLSTYAAVAKEVQYGASSGGGLSQSASMQYDDGIGQLTLLPGSAQNTLDITGTSTIVGAHMKNASTGSTSAALWELENPAGALAYYGITPSTYSGFAPFDGGQAAFGSYAVPLSLFTQSASPIIFYTNGAEVGSWLVGGGLQVASLGAGGPVRATAATGLLSIFPWPSSSQVLISTGTATDPAGDSTFTFDRVAHVMAGGNAIGINGVSVPTNVSLVAGHTTNADRDRVQLFVGGGALGGTGTSDDTLLDIIPSAVAIRGGVTGGIYSLQRLRAVSYSGASTLTEATTLYIDGAPSLGGGISSTGPWAIHVANGVSLFNQTLQITSLGGGGIVASDPATGGRLGIAGVGGLPAAVSAELPYYINVAGSTLVTGANVWLATSSTAGAGATAIEYPHAFAAAYANLTIRVTTNAITSGTWAAAITRNGSNFSTLGFTSVTSGTVTTGTVSVGSPASGDRWGVAVGGTGTGMSGNMVFTATLMLAPNVF